MNRNQEPGSTVLKLRAQMQMFREIFILWIVIRKQEILKVTLLDFSNYATSLPRTKYKSKLNI